MIGPDQSTAPDLERSQTDDDPRQEELDSREREFQLAMACLLTSPVMNEVERRPRKKDRVKRLKRKSKGKKKKQVAQQPREKEDSSSTARTSR
ncbi:Hypp317 [Branchiostoma lanceolatum]|uniref:Hypp317 protein n=1 Tax=Branchiostoma lanceolatum TaxID=7740 RepID=A0A8J9YN48_BRALA|nr:Hypp317 [Branchiostoma lanceolatum]